MNRLGNGITNNTPLDTRTIPPSFDNVNIIERNASIMTRLFTITVMIVSVVTTIIMTGIENS
ncbi:MAG: hypothetical protein WCF23_18890 [Candidatus Nitrosopolaris sp.]